MSAQRLAEITRAAEGLFGAQGYHRTTMRQVARALDLQGGSLYAHIESKEALLAAIVERAAETFEQRLDQALASSPHPEARLRAAITGHIGVITDNLPAAAVYFQDWRHLDPQRRRAILSRRDAYERRWREVVAEGRDAGVLTTADPAMAARLCLSTCNWVYQWFDPQGAMTAEEVAQHVADLLLHGLSEAPEPPSTAPRRTPVAS